ncbi:MAG: hypothetical protein K2X47_12205 [Bdellovibrionales bacterium]|nr:hypothetical protein [Bdellovibrionales bacterium]
MAQKEKPKIAVSYRLEPEILAQLFTLTSLRPGSSEVETIRDLITVRYEIELKADRDRVLKQRSSADEGINERLRLLAKGRKQKK